jgi:hypothetical protein
MLIKSKFRKLFWVRMGFLFLVFILLFCFCLKGMLYNSGDVATLFSILIFIMLLFLLYISTDLFKIYSLTITKIGIEKVQVITNQKQLILFIDIISIEKKKYRIKSSGRYITDGYHVSVIKLKNGEILTISPDNFENYQEIMSAIKNNSEDITFI